VAPLVVFFITRRICRELLRGEVIERDREQAEAEAEAQAAGV
jgi:hypothetical protein